jgi:hypothetical protein
VLTGLKDRELALEAMRLGAQDYLVKGEFDGKLLGRSLAYAIERGMLVANLRQIIDKAADGMVVVDAEGVVRYMNRSAEQLFGREAEELLGTAFPLPLAPNTTTKVSLPRGDGATRIIQLSIQSLDWQNEPSLLASMRELTELRHFHWLSQELKAPLSIIQTVVEQLENGSAGPVTPHQRQLLELLRDNASSASATLDERAVVPLAEASAPNQRP